MSVPKAILKKIRNYEIRIRKAVNAQMQGDFHSVFKGSGLEFDDVRTYQYGDDVRHIDWNVSAKGHGTFIKTFREEKEQNLFFLLDVSASQEIGKPGQQKMDIAKEICSVLCLSGIKEQYSVGLLCFSEQKEKYVKPGKGAKHGYLMVNTLFQLQPDATKTDLNKAILQTMGMVKRKSVIIMISDFLDEGYETNLKALGHQHDLIVIHIADDREGKLPSLGIIPLYDKEAKKRVWVNTSSPGFRENVSKFYSQNQQALADLCHRNDINYLHIHTHEDYVPQLIKLFRIRNQYRK